MKNRLQDNIALWAKSNPIPSVFLPYIESSFSCCKTEKGEFNLKLSPEKGGGYLHAQSSARDEAKEWFAQLDLENVEILVVFGVGLGYAYPTVLPWLRQNANRHLVFLEDNLELIRHLFELEMGSLILTDKQVQLVYFKNLEDNTSPLNELYWNFLSLKIAVSALPFYAESRSGIFSDLKHKIFYDATLRHGHLEEYLNYGVAYYHNFYPNMLRMPGASLGDGLKGKFKNIPAIICGAGPSLNKHFGLLKEIGERALIFAGGSSLNSLNSQGIQPHLGAGIDPNPEQFERLKNNTAHELPFVYRARMEHRAFKTIRGPKLYISGSGGYDTARWFEEKLGIIGPEEGSEIDEGYNVVNFCTDIARSWGCNPIIFIGMDLAFTDLHAYASGVIDKTKINIEKMLENEDLDEQPILKEDIYGKPIYTLWKWIAEAQWLSDFAKVYPEISIINATEGGIGFSGIPNETFSSAIQQHLQQSYELRGRLHSEIQNQALPQITRERMVALMGELSGSLIRCQEHLTILIKESDKILNQMKKEQKLPTILQSGSAALAEIELAEELGYVYLLNMFNIVYSKILNKELREITRNEETSELEKAIQKMAMNNRKLSFLRDVAIANVALIGESLSQELAEETT